MSIKSIISHHVIQRILHSLPIASAAIVFIVPSINGEWFIWIFDELALARIMQIEFLVVASGLLLALPAFWQPESKAGNVFRLLILFVLAYAFALAAYDINHVYGLVSFVFLMYATYQNSFIAAIRWFVCVCLFFPLLIYFDLGKGNVENWAYREGIIPFGAIFFGILTILEITIYYTVRVKSKEQSEYDDLTYKRRVKFNEKLK